MEELHSHCNPRSQLDEKIKRNEPFHEKKLQFNRPPRPTLCARHLHGLESPASTIVADWPAP